MGIDRKDDPGTGRPRRSDTTTADGDGERSPSAWPSGGERGRRPNAVVPAGLGGPPRREERRPSPDRHQRTESTRGPVRDRTVEVPAATGGRPRALQASTEHRNAASATLRPEQLPVAEQLLRGGIPALRRAIDEQNARARSEGRTEVAPELLLSMADELLPKMNLAAWKDRAVGARAADRDCPFASSVPWLRQHRR